MHHFATQGHVYLCKVPSVLTERNKNVDHGLTETDSMTSSAITLPRYSYANTELVQENRDLYNRCVSEAECEVYVPARAHSLPTDDERILACATLGDGWEVAANQEGARPGFVKCFNRALFERRMAQARSSTLPLTLGILGGLATLVIVAGLLIRARRR